MKLSRNLGRLRGGLEVGRGSSQLGTTAALLAGVLALELLMIGSYVGALHKPEPRDVPIAVTGPPQLRAALRAQLARGGVLAPRPAPSRAAALRMIDEREVYGAFVSAADGDTLIVAPAASSSVAELLPVIARRAAPQRPLRTEVVKPLPAEDARGLSPFYLVVGWLVGGYVGATMLGLARGGAARSPRWAVRRLSALAVYAVASGILGTLLVQQLVGVLGGNTGALMAAGALIVFATSAATAALQAALGVAGTALAIALFVALGNPASGGPLASELLMPGLWRAVGWLLPPGAGTTLVRNVAYFDSNAIGRPLVVLTAYGAVGAVIFIAAAKWRARSTKEEAAAAAGAAAAA